MSKTREYLICRAAFKGAAEIAKAPLLFALAGSIWLALMVKEVYSVLWFLYHQKSDTLPVPLPSRKALPENAPAILDNDLSYRLRIEDLWIESPWRDAPVEVIAVIPGSYPSL